jgi:hypothetical protein
MVKEKNLNPTATEVQDSINRILQDNSESYLETNDKKALNKMIVKYTAVAERAETASSD